MLCFSCVPFWLISLFDCCCCCWLCLPVVGLLFIFFLLTLFSKSKFVVLSVANCVSDSFFWCSNLLFNLTLFSFSASNFFVSYVSSLFACFSFSLILLISFVFSLHSVCACYCFALICIISFLNSAFSIYIFCCCVLIYFVSFFCLTLYLVMICVIPDFFLEFSVGGLIYFLCLGQSLFWLSLVI